MDDRFFASISKGMTVEDADGDKVGTVGDIFQSVEVASPVSTAATASTAAVPAAEAVMKVDTGFLGLGSNLYIPTSAIRDVTRDRIILKVDRARKDQLGWDEKPVWIDESQS